MRPIRFFGAMNAAAISAAMLLATPGRVLGQPVLRASPSTPVFISIRDQQAVVREPWMVESAAGTSRVVFAGLPLETDIRGIMIQDRRGATRILDWQAPAWPAGGVVATGAGRSVQVQVAPTPLADSLDVVARLASSTRGAKSIDVIYPMTGLSWRVSYDVLIRGDLSDITGPMSIDVDGWIEVHNQTSRAFSNVILTVIGPDTLGEKALAKPPGLLDLDEDSPLSDLWRFRPPEPLTPNRYRIRTNLFLPAHENVIVHQVAARRKPVDRILLLRSEDIPTDSRIGLASPSQIISFRNAPDYGGGQAVPPGPALIHLGSQRATLHQRAWFKHTPAQGEIRIDMGKVSGVTARRINRGRVDRVDGGYEQVFELRIENSLSQPVQLVLDEQPPVTLAWTLLRANQPHDRLDRRIIFKPRVEPKSEAVIQYTLRVTPPSN